MLDRRPGNSVGPCSPPPGSIPGRPVQGRRIRVSSNRGKGVVMAQPVVTMKQLLEAGVHFGHQTRRWNPKM